MTSAKRAPADRIKAARRDLSALRAELTEALRTERTRKRGPMVRMMHEVQGMLIPGFPYASQSGQDQAVERILQGKRGGVFVDIGAYDGLTGSNSLYFEKYLGWSGTLVEPVKQSRDKAEVWRSSPCLPYAIAEADGEASFIAVTQGYTQMSGIEGAYDAGLLSRVRSDPRHAEERITVQTRSLNSLFAELGLTQVDFVSLDIEGGELAALQAFDPATCRVDVWAIENNTGGSQIASLMRERGYNLTEFCGVDEIYVRNDL
ncbi:FkbM family methyltransferase [Loktanella sp. R86503]|uniref:FkbM family methyltransferase n=1 Tax=Loktanella sp. R86503 TaxID=3093847 RepID=UPI0036DDA014